VLSLSTPWRLREGEVVKVRPFLTSTWDGDQLLPSYVSLSTPRPLPIEKDAGWSLEEVWKFLEEETNFFPCRNSSTGSSIPWRSQYTDWAIPAPDGFGRKSNFGFHYNINTFLVSSSWGSIKHLYETNSDERTKRARSVHGEVIWLVPGILAFFFMMVFPTC